MTALPRQIAFDHCPVYDPTRPFEGCKCGVKVTGQAHQEHVIEVTEAAVREMVAADIEAQANEYLALAPTGTFETSRHNGLTAAARIARGEVTP